MADQTTKPKTTGQTLYEAGWRQGSVFKLEGAAVYFNKILNGATLGAGNKLVKRNQWLVVTSQECDIVAPDDKEPYIEAMVCRKESANHVNNIRNKSARSFAVDPDNCIVANAPYKLQLDKGLLLGVTPQPWPSTDENFDLFVRWLATRYDRPSVSDEIVKVFDNPVRDVLEQLAEDQPVVWDVFNKAVRETRVTPQLREDPPYELHITLLSRSVSLTDEELEAVNRVYDKILSCVDRTQVSLDDEPRWVSSETISLAEYEQTRLLSLEFLSYQGDTPIGALPVAR